MPVCALFLLAEMEVLFALLRSTYSRLREKEERKSAGIQICWRAAAAPTKIAARCLLAPFDLDLSSTCLDVLSPQRSPLLSPPISMQRERERGERNLLPFLGFLNLCALKIST